MSQLGYTWYPQDWWTSETFKRLKRYPMVRYAIRELFDLMYKEGKPITMNRDYLIDDFSIELSDDEYNKLLDFISIDEDGKWWIKSIRKRMNKADTARENGSKGGAPKGNRNARKNIEKTTQQPTETTNGNNPNNPPYKIEREIESKIEIKDDESSMQVSSTATPGLIFISEAKKILDMGNDGFALIATRRTGKSHKILEKLIDGFLEAQNGYGKKSWPNEQDLRKHFIDWVNKQKNEKNNTGFILGAKPMGAVDHGE